MSAKKGAETLQRIAGLDLLRFIGACSVIALHLQLLRGTPSWLYKALHGGNGVTLFFVISGFLITALICREVQATGALDVKRFMLRRALRIFPLFYFVLACYAAISIAGIQSPKDGSFWFAAFYLYNFIPKSMWDGWLGSFHTLATEEHFYLLYPLLWLLCLRLRTPIWTFLLALLALTPFLLSWSSPFGSTFLTGIWTFNAWGPILIGCLAGYYFVHFEQAHTRGFRLLAAACVLIIPAAMTRTPLPLACGFALLILWLAYNQSRPWIARLNARPIRFLGEISYGLYVWQSLILGTGPARSLVKDPLLATALIFLLATGSWFLLEKPLLRLRDKLRRPDRREITSPDSGVPIRAA